MVLPSTVARTISNITFCFTSQNGVLTKIMPLNLLFLVNLAITNDWCKGWSDTLRLSLAPTRKFPQGNFFKISKLQQTRCLRETVANNQQLFQSILHDYKVDYVYSKLIFLKKNQQVIIILSIYLIPRRASFFLVSSI